MLTIESMEGIQSVQTYATKKGAIEALNQVTKDIETRECTEEYFGNCEAAQISDSTLYVVQKPEDAVSLVNKLVWTVNQRLYIEKIGIPSSCQWTQLYSTKSLALAHLEAVSAAYLMTHSELEVTCSEDGLRKVFSKNGELNMTLFCEPIRIDNNATLTSDYGRE